jgi:hypothetical protein
LIEALYEDKRVEASLKRHAIPYVAAGAPIWQRFPSPIALSSEVLRELYEECGLGLYHIELLTGHPAMTIEGKLRRLGISLRPPGGRSPFLKRWRRRRSRKRGPPLS